MFKRCVFVATVALLCASPACSQPTPQGTLKADGSLRWMRGNMHTHTLWSDGDDYPEMVAGWYRDQGYQFLVFTDHNILHRSEKWVSIEKSKGGRAAFDRMVQTFGPDWAVTRNTENAEEVRLKSFDEVFDRIAVPQEYLLIQGEEISDSFQKLPVHLCASNVSELLPPAGGDSLVDVMQRNLQAAIAMRERSGVQTLVHLNHPNFHYAITAEQMMQVPEERFFEVYNGHPGVDNRGDETHASTERMWDIINTFRLSKLRMPLMMGLATDDGHNYHNTEPGKGAQPGRGWVMVLTGSLTPDALVESLEAGRFYASSGVFLNAVTWTGQELTVEVSGQPGRTCRIDFIGTRRGFDDSSVAADGNPNDEFGKTRRYTPDVGAVLQSSEGSVATYRLTGDEFYVRAVVTSSHQHPNPSQPGEFERAWTQPVTGPAALFPE